jgi:hypothetical protein
MRAIAQLSPPIPEWVSPEAAKFIFLALDKSIVTRAPVMRLIQHPWIQSRVGSSCAGWVGGCVRCAVGAHSMFMS